MAVSEVVKIINARLINILVHPNFYWSDFFLICVWEFTYLRTSLHILSGPYYHHRSFELKSFLANKRWRHTVYCASVAWPFLLLEFSNEGLFFCLFCPFIPYFFITIISALTFSYPYHPSHHTSVFLKLTTSRSCLSNSHILSVRIYRNHSVSHRWWHKTAYCKKNLAKSSKFRWHSCLYYKGIWA